MSVDEWDWPRPRLRQWHKTLLALLVGLFGMIAIGSIAWVGSHTLDVYLITRAQILESLGCKLFVPVLVTNDEGERVAVYQCRE